MLTQCFPGAVPTCVGGTWEAWGPLWPPVSAPLSLAPLSSHRYWPSQEYWQGSGPASFLCVQVTQWELYMWPTPWQGVSTSFPPFGRMSWFALRKGKQPWQPGPGMLQSNTATPEDTNIRQGHSDCSGARPLWNHISTQTKAQTLSKA